MKKILFLFKFGLFVFMCLILHSIVFAENTIPNTLNVQGRYTKSYGDPVVNTEIKVYLQISDGSNWKNASEYPKKVKTDSEGLYNINVPVDLTSHPKYFRVSINKEPTDSDKYEFSSSPYAFYASTANYAVGASSIFVSTTATTDVVWGRDGSTGEQRWVSPESISVDTATWAKILIPVSEGGTTLVDDNFKQSTATWDDSNTYKIAVGSASYAKNTTTATYAESLKIDFVLSTANFSLTDLYKINVDTAIYAVGASSISITTTTTNGVTWGIRDGVQQWISVSSISITTATQTSIGGIMLGDNTGLSASIDGDAVLRVTSATAAKIGGVIIGENINIDDSGKISVSTGSASEFGVVKVKAENGLAISDGEISISTGSKDTFGVFKAGENINVDETGVISISTYTAGDGIVISGTTITANVDGTNIVIKDGKIDLGSGADIAEIYKSTEKLVPGDVVSIDTRKDNSIVKTKVAEDTLVAGVISTEPGVLLNKTEKGYKLALVGKVPTKVCNEGGSIKRGDLLVSASLAGYAKKAGDNPKAGTVIGKALENFDSQKGTILVLVNLQ